VGEEAGRANDDTGNAISRRRDKKGSYTEIILIGILFVLTDSVIDIFFSYILFSYFKSGNENDPRTQNPGQQVCGSKNYDYNLKYF